MSNSNHLKWHDKPTRTDVVLSTPTKTNLPEVWHHWQLNACGKVEKIDPPCDVEPEREPCPHCGNRDLITGWCCDSAASEAMEKSNAVHTGEGNLSMDSVLSDPVTPNEWALMDQIDGLREDIDALAALVNDLVLEGWGGLPSDPDKKAADDLSQCLHNIFTAKFEGGIRTP